MPRVILDSLNLADAERAIIIEALALTGSILKASAMLGCSRGVLRGKMRKYKIEGPRSPKAEEPCS